MKQANRLAYFRQLCCLGLGGEVLVPDLMKVLGELLPFTYSVFLWTDAQGQPVNLALDQVVPSSLQAFTEAPQLFEAPGEPWVPRLVNGPRLTGNLAPFHDAAFYQRSAIYHYLYKPYGVVHGLDGSIRDGTRPRALVILYREPCRRAFTPREERLLAQLLPYMRLALDRGPPSPGEGWVDSADCGTLLASRDGRVQFASPSARRLLVYATAPCVAPGVRAQADSEAAGAVLRRLCRQLLAVQGSSDAGPPALSLCNAWGRFRLQAFPMLPQPDAGWGAPADPVVILIRRLQPLRLRVAQRLGQLPLSPREREVAQLLALGVERAEVELRLGIGGETVRDHVRRIYAKLGVHTRSELRAQLVE